MSISGIPEYSERPLDGMLLWFATTSERELLFHPDDPAETIYAITTGEATFSPDESRKANEILKTMFNQYGDKVYEVSYPIFMKRMGIQLDS